MANLFADLASFEFSFISCDVPISMADFCSRDAAPTLKIRYRFADEIRRTV